MTDLVPHCTAVESSPGGWPSHLISDLPEEERERVIKDLYGEAESSD